MPSPAQEWATCHADIRIRRGSPQDIAKLVRIDADASSLFEHAGLHIESPNQQEVARAERSRWLRCLAAGTVLIAADRVGQDIGFAALDVLDGEPFLDQLSVCISSMRQGIGTELLFRSIKMAEPAGG